MRTSQVKPIKIISNNLYWPQPSYLKFETFTFCFQSTCAHALTENNQTFKGRDCEVLSGQAGGRRKKQRGQKRKKQKPVVLKGPRKVSVLFSFSVSFARSEDATGAMLCYQIQLLRNWPCGKALTVRWSFLQFTFLARLCGSGLRLTNTALYPAAFITSLKRTDVTEVRLHRTQP